MQDIEAGQALQNRVWRSLVPVTTALTALYILFTVSHLLLLPAQLKVPMALMAGATSAIFFALSMTVRSMASLQRRPYPIALLVILLLSTNCAVHIRFTEDIVHTTNFMLVIVGAGFLVLSGPWYVAAVGVSLALWGLAVADVWGQPLSVHFAFALLSATVASVIFRHVLVRDLVENHALRLISERQRKEMEYRATHDFLTGLANRRKFRERLALEVARANRSGNRVAVLYIDLDNFKPMNDCHGHDYGDEVLKFLAVVLRELSRETDLVCRLGGDEFALLLTELKDASAADVVVSKVLQRFERPETINDISTKISLSIGTAILPDDASTPEELMRFADRRMYAHKEGRRSQGAES